MSEERARGNEERARLFVALDLPGEARSALERWQSETLRGISGLRKVAPDALHATLCFLGWRDVSEIEEIGDACVAAVSGSGAGAPPLSLSGAIWLPRRDPRVLAVELEDESGELPRLQAAVSKALSAGGWYAPEARQFLAHVTVARVGRSAGVRSAKLQPVPSVAFDGAAVTLYRSHLSPRGARYEPLRRVRLGEAGAEVSSDPLAIVREFYVEQRRAYAGGDLDALRSWLTEAVVWHVPGRSRIAGDHRGIDAVLAYFDTRRRMTDETFRIEVRGLSLVGDRVVQLAGGTAVVDGHEVSWETVGVFRVEDGRIAECWLVPFDLYAFDEIWR